MGAGDCPKDTEAQLLQEALKLNLGFSESQLSGAIKHLVKEFGSLEDAPAWIRQDNFTVLVNYILDNANTESESLQPRSESVQVWTEHVKKSANKQRERGGKLSSRLKEAPNGFLSDGNTPSRNDSSGDKIDQYKDLSPSQKGRLDRKALRLHYREKLLTNSVKNNKSSADSEVNEVRSSSTLISQVTSENSNGQSIAEKKARSSLDQIEHLSHMMPKVIPLQRLNAQPRNEDQLTTKRRGQQLNGFVNIAQKKGKISESEAIKKSFWETRTLMPSGCQDLATGPGGCHVGSAELRSLSPIEIRRPTGKSPAHDEMIQTKIVTKQSAERKAVANENCAPVERPCGFVDLDGSDEIPDISSRVKSKDINCIMRKTETCRESSSIGQKASSSALDKSVAKEVGKDCQTHDTDGLFLEQLEASLKEGNCQRALDIVNSWKIKDQQVGLRQIKGDFLKEEHEVVPDVPGRKKGFVVSYDISRGLEKLPISCVNEYNTDVLHDNFLYITRSVIRHAAHVDISFSRIGDLHCCCSDDCLRSSEACKCTDSTRGEYAYDDNGRLIERLAIGFVSGCTTINGDFITECCDKCRCSMKCGNRIVQRGITKKLQVFMTPKKGWGVRALEKIPARTFVFEYLGEIATNSEQYDRNSEYAANGVYTYVMCLDADLDMEKKHFKEGLTDHEALVLDATIYGNVSRFVNHRCIDANLFMRPVQIETRDTHYYHAALFAARDIEEMEELTWDYGIDFDDDTHSLKAFKCYCKSSFCRDRVRLNQDTERKGKLVKSGRR